MSTYEKHIVNSDSSRDKRIPDGRVKSAQLLEFNNNWVSHESLSSPSELANLVNEREPTVKNTPGPLSYSHDRKIKNKKVSFYPFVFYS